MVRGHPRSSSAISSFHRAHTISYSSLIETMRLSCTVFEIQRVICRNSPTYPYPTSIWRQRSNFEKIFSTRKLDSLGYIVWRYLRFPVFSHFSRTPTCDRHTDRLTDGQTDRHMTMAYTALA